MSNHVSGDYGSRSHISRASSNWTDSQRSKPTGEHDDKKWKLQNEIWNAMGITQANAFGS